MKVRTLAIGVLVLVAACVRPADQRAALDIDVGLASVAALAIEVDGGAAQVLELSETRAALWSQAPTLALRVTTGPTALVAYEFEFQNAMPAAVLSASIDGNAIAVTELAGARPTQRRFALDLPTDTEVTLRLATADADQNTAWRFAVMGDIQTALDSVDEVFVRINAQPDVQFVISTGDLVETGSDSEYELLLKQFEVLDVPYYSTIGNHELTTQQERWHDQFGRYTTHFDYKGVAFSLVDSGSATIDPLIYDRLNTWLTAGRDRVHIFATHYPPLDPVGPRSGSFRSRVEAAKLLSRLAQGRVDLTLYGHIHSYYAYSNADIPAYISGGGGALPERFDGIGRHFLVVDIDPILGVSQVAITRVD